MKFKKICVMEPSNLFDTSVERLKQIAEEVVTYDTVPQNDEEIIRRIDDADAVILSYTSGLSRNVLDTCKNIKYIGLSCTLYPPKSCNVDLYACEEKGIKVTGISDYGDEGVVEYVISELVQLLHNYGNYRYEGRSVELTNTPVGIVGMGNLGFKIGKALQFFGAKVRYYGPREKDYAKEAGFEYCTMDELLEKSTVLCTFLTKNVTVLYDEQLEKFGTHKIIVNTGLCPSFVVEAMNRWLSKGDTFLLADSDLAFGDIDEKFMKSGNATCKYATSGGTRQCIERLNDKVLENIINF